MTTIKCDVTHCESNSKGTCQADDIEVAYHYEGEFDYYNCESMKERRR